MDICHLPLIFRYISVTRRFNFLFTLLVSTCNVFNYVDSAEFAVGIDIHVNHFVDNRSFVGLEEVVPILAERVLTDIYTWRIDIEDV